MKGLNNILYVSAIDDEGNLCFAFNEDKTQKKKYVCPNCGVPMTLKKSDKVGKYTKRPHFAHKVNEEHDCCPETVLHSAFKTELYRLLKERLEKQLPFEFEWKCQSCKDIHTGNLLKVVKNVYLEKDLGDCRPDILLTDTNDKPVFAVEVVVTHKPEEKTLHYYKDNKIWLYQIDLYSDEDLKNIENIANKPTNFDVCLRPKCVNCEKKLTRRTIYVNEEKCAICNKTINVTMGQDERKGLFPPDIFNEDEINFATEHNVHLQVFHLVDLNTLALFNVCPHCNNYVKDLYFDTKMPLIGKKDSYYCEYCEYLKNHPFDNQKCDKCGGNLTTRTINVYYKLCNKCNAPIKIAEGDYGIRPYQFTKEQIDYSIQNGANIQKIQSSIYEEPFYANVCPNCGDFGNDGNGGQLLTSKYFPHCKNCERYNEPRYNNPTEVCNVCGRKKVKRTLYIVETCCYQCKSPLKVAFIKEPNGDFSFRLNQWHKSKAESFGVVFQNNEDSPMVCPSCNASISRFHVTDYITCKEIWHDDSTFYCPTCYRQNKYKTSINH